MRNISTAIAIFLGALFLVAHTATAHTSTAVVIMDKAGFTPAELTVDTDQTILFVNKDTKDRWPASNLHPTHDLYPEFDPTAPIKPGETWEFPPNNVGRWDFHDHLSPQIRGKLIVAAEDKELAGHDVPDQKADAADENFLGTFARLMSDWFASMKRLLGIISAEGLAEESADTSVELPAYAQGADASAYFRDIMTMCFRSGGSNDCYKTAAKQFFQEFGLKQSLALFAQNEADPDVYARCHEVTHYLSRHEFERVGSVPKVYAACDSTCHGGCYHGTLEAYLAQAALQPTDKDLENAFTQICGTRSDYTSLLIFSECHHGLGHAAMFVSDSDVPRSLALCDKLPSLSTREYCYSGVFMENSSSSTNLDHPSSYIKAQDPYYPCNSLDERYLKICYRYQSSHFSLITKHDWKKVADLCLGVPESYRSECFRTVGTNQVGFTSDMNTWLANCASMPAEHQATCVTGVVSSLAYRFVGDIKKMEDFCSQNPLHQQEPCVNQLGTAFRDWSESAAQRREWCTSLASADFRRWCSEGLNSSDT